jgi:hypothetical protein
MKVMLQAHILWDAIEYGDWDFQEDCMAREVLILLVPPEMVPRWPRRSQLQKHGMPSRRCASAATKSKRAGLSSCGGNLKP